MDYDDVMWNAENAPTVVRHAHDLLTACTQEQFVDKVHNSYTHHSTLS